MNSVYFEAHTEFDQLFARPKSRCFNCNLLLLIGLVTMTTREAPVIDIVDSLQNLSSPGRKHMLKFVYSKIVLEKSLNE